MCAQLTGEEQKCASKAKHSNQAADLCRSTPRSLLSEPRYLRWADGGTSEWHKCHVNDQLSTGESLPVPPSPSSRCYLYFSQAADQVSAPVSVYTKWARSASCCRGSSSLLCGYDFCMLTTHMTDGKPPNFPGGQAAPQRTQRIHNGPLTTQVQMQEINIPLGVHVGVMDSRDGRKWGRGQRKGRVLGEETEGKQG